MCQQDVVLFRRESAGKFRITLSAVIDSGDGDVSGVAGLVDKIIYSAGAVELFPVIDGKPGFSAFPVSGDGESGSGAARELFEDSGKQRKF